MPSIESLMELWPSDVEELLAELQRNNAQKNSNTSSKQPPLSVVDLDVGLRDLARIVCAVLDVPVYDGQLIQSLHVVFTLYAEFMANPHFQRLAISEPEEKQQQQDSRQADRIDARK